MYIVQSIVDFLTLPLGCNLKPTFCIGRFLVDFLNESLKEKTPQSGVGSMQGKDTGNMPSAVCASSMNKSLDPTPI